MIKYDGLIFILCLVSLLGCKFVWGLHSRVYDWAFLIFGCGMAATLASVLRRSFDVGCLL